MTCDKVVQGKKEECYGSVGVDEPVKRFSCALDKKEDDGDG